MVTDQPTGIMYRVWETDSPRAAIVLVHGLGAHSARWEKMASFLQGRGVSVYAPELQGFGLTASLKGHIDSFNIYYGQIGRIYDIVSHKCPGVPVFIAGESLGGLIAFLVVLKSIRAFSGLIAIAPAFRQVLRLSPMFYAAVFFCLLIKPKKQFVMPFSLSMCTRDSEYCALMEKDPREHRLASARLLFETEICGRIASARAFEMTLPVLFMLPGKDLLVYSETSRNIFEKIASPQKKLIEYPQMYHALSIDIGKEKVFEDILDWMNKLI
jgi:alpha-beta hydrolase superfamily lysophospholipase